MTVDETNLPLASAPQLTLEQATAEEKLAIWRLNGTEWAGRLSMEAYLRREEFLANQTFTRHGGITFWILVDVTKEPNKREILSSCETLRKRAYVSRAQKDGAGNVEEIVSHGIGSVFCNPSYRGRGYASRMLKELGEKLDTWQQPYGYRSDFTVLFSDIGKDFYAKNGWNAFQSSHLVLPPVSDDRVNETVKVNLLKSGDLKQLCAMDEGIIIKEGLVRQSTKAGKTMVAVIPDIETIEWHHAREEFWAKEMLGKSPEIKGAFVHCNDDSRVWCIWSRFFGTEAKEDVFHIIRLAIEGEEDLTSNVSSLGISEEDVNPKDVKVSAVVALLRAAQNEASKWQMPEIQMWNPTPLAVRAARVIDPSLQIVHREEHSIACLRWHGSEQAGNVEWLGNEKYAWC